MNRESEKNKRNSDNAGQKTTFLSNQRGNIFFTLFGAIAVVGLIGAGVVATMRGPLSTMVEVNNRAKAQSEMMIASRLALLEATQLPSDGDCDADGFVEPLEWVDASGAGPDGVFGSDGGGFLPAEVGSSHLDPWGTQYGYCAWDAGGTIDAIACDTNTDSNYYRLDGNGGVADETYTVIALISAGPDGVFETICEQGASPGATKGGDDLLTTYTYAAAAAETGGLWNIKSGDPSTAEISKDLEVTGGASFTSGIDLTTSTAALQLGAASMLFPTEGTLSTCNAANDGLMRLNTTGTPDYLEICDNPTGWVSVAEGAPGLKVWKDDGPGGPAEIYYNGGNVGIGTNDPAEALDVAGNIAATGNLSSLGLATSGAASIGGTLGVTGAATLSSTLGVTGATTLTTLNATGAVDFDTTLNVDGASTLVGTLNGQAAVDFDSTLNVDGATTLVGTLDAQGTISNSTGSVVLGDNVDVTGNIDAQGTIVNSLGDVAVNDNLDVTGDITATGAVSAGTTINVNGDQLGPASNCLSSEKLQWSNGSGWSCVADLQGGSGGGAPNLEDVLTTGNDANTLTAINLGGVVIGDTSLSSGTEALELDVTGEIGATKYCDADGNNCFTTGEMNQNIAEVLATGNDAGGATALMNLAGMALGSSVISNSTNLDLRIDVTGDVGAIEYCDENGNNCFTAASVASGSGGLWTAGTGDDIYYNSGTPRVGIGTASPVVSLDLGSVTDALLMPRGTTAQRPTGANGMMRYNSSNDRFEGYQAGGWQDILTNSALAADPDRGIQFNSGGSFGAEANFTYTSAGDFIVGSYQLDDTGTGSEDSRMFFDVSKGAFRAGGVAGTEWDDTNVGNRSIALGKTAIASNTDTIALGSDTTASGYGGTAIGYRTTASSSYSTALGLDTTASGSVSTAMGYFTTASGSYSTAMGRNTIATGSYSIAIGQEATVTATGTNSVAFGLGNSTGASPQVSGASSFGIFMGDQGGVDFSSANTLGLFGGRMVIDPAVPATNLITSTGGEQDLELDVAGDVGAANYCDADGNNCFTAASVASGGGGLWTAGTGDDIYYNSGTPRVGIGTASPVVSLDLGSVTDALLMPRGTTAQRPTGANGMLRYNSSNDRFEGYQAGSWQDILTNSGLAADPDRGIQFNSGGSFGAEANFTYTSAGDFIVGSYQLDDTGTGSEDTRMFFDVSKGAFRAGGVAGTEWDDVNVGNYSVALGGVGKASGLYSVSLMGGQATGDYSFAMGTAALASGGASIAMGYGTGTEASGNGSIAIGSRVKSNADYSMALGLGSHSFGLEPTVSGISSFGIFMGSQDSVNVSAPNTMAVLGGKIVLDPAIPATELAASTGGEQDLELDVTGDIGATNYCDADGNNCFTASAVGTANAHGVDGNIQFNSAGGLWSDNSLIFTSTGRLGIGTSLPETLLDAQGTLRIADGGEACASGTAGAIRYSSGNTLDYCDGSAWQTIVYSGAGTGGLWTSGTGDDIYYNSGTPQVGIGLTDPAVSLDVAGLIRPGYDTACTATEEGSIRYDSASNTAELCDGASWLAVNTGSGGKWLDATVSGDIRYSSGDVGIYTSDPLVALDVNGTLRIADGGETCDGTIPGAIRYRSGIGVEYCDGTSWLAVSINGAGVILDISPPADTNMDVTGPAVPSDGTTVSFIVTNNGDVTSNVLSYTLDNTTNFIVIADTCTGNTLAQNATCQIDITPRTSGDGLFSGTLTIPHHNAPDAILQGLGSGFTCAPGQTAFGGIVATCDAYGAGLHMIVTPGNCDGTINEPTCDGGADTYTRAWSSEFVLLGSTVQSSTAGDQNTVNIIEYGRIGLYPAAEYCNNLVYNGYSDWYLPSSAEATTNIYPNQAAIGGLVNAYYWTSRENTTASGEAYSYNPVTGIPYSTAGNKLSAFRIRCARKEGVALPAAQADDTPGTISFATKFQSTAAVRTSSDIATITAITPGISVSIAGAGTPRIKINGGAEVTSGTVSWGDTVQLVMDSPAIGSRNDATFTLGSQTYSYSVVTEPDCGGSCAGVDKRVFITSINYTNGTYGGLVGADAKCQTQADAAALGGTWRALISGENVSEHAAHRMDYNWDRLLNINGQVVADNPTDLWDGTIQNPINYDENGAVQTGRVWTGTNTNGNVISGYTCNDWTAASPALGSFGDIGTSGSTWIYSATTNCNGDYRIYCAEVNTPTITLSLSPTSQSGMDVSGPGAPAYGSNVTFTATNTGTGTSGVLTASLSSSANFEILNDNCTGNTLAGAASCTYDVRPLAYADGTYSSTTTISDGTYSDNAGISGTASGFIGVSPAFQSTGGAGSEVVTSIDATAPHATADFVFGSPQLDDDADPNHDARMFFDKAKSAFRAGIVTGTQWDNANVGTNSVAMGGETTASGINSTAMGGSTTASGSNSTAAGVGTIASGTASTAMGTSTIANGTASVALGSSGIASGDYSMAIGQDATVTATGVNSFALGLGDATGASPQVSGARSFGIFMGDQSGVDVTAANTMALMGATGFGIGTVSPATLLDVQGTIRVADGGETCAAGVAGGIRYGSNSLSYCDGTAWQTLVYSGSGSGGIWENASDVVRLSSTGAHTTADFVVGSPQLDDDTDPNHDNRMFFDKSKGAFRVGTAYNNWWNDANNGINSVAMGYRTQATAGNSFAMGNQTVASGTASTALGYASTASGTNSFAAGQSANASGSYSLAAGRQTTASGSGSVAVGYLTTASLGTAFASGTSTTASDYNATAMGNNTTASANDSMATGSYTTAAGDSSVAMGQEVTITATGDNSFAFGLGNDADGLNLPQVSGARSFGIFMGDQSGVDVTAANTMALMGATGFGIGTVSPATLLDVQGTLRVADGGETCAAGVAGGIRYGSNSLSYCDGTAWQTLVYSGSGTGGIWENSSDVVKLSSTGAYTTADFVFGSPQLADDGDSTHDSRMFFDKSKGAFRAGAATGTQWDDVNVGANSIAIGLDAKATGLRSFAAGSNTTASGDDSVSLGAYTAATATRSFAVGGAAQASGLTSVAMGYDVIASGNNSFGFGLGSTASVNPTVSGSQSFGIFMGDQGGVDLAQANTMALMGATGFGIGTVSPATLLDIQGTIRVADGGETCAAGVAGGIRYGSNSLYYCDGTTWQTIANSGSTTAAGTTGQIQYNSGGILAADNNFFWDITNSRLGLGTTTPGSGVHVVADNADIRLDQTAGASTAVDIIFAFGGANWGGVGSIEASEKMRIAGDLNGNAVGGFDIASNYASTDPYLTVEANGDFVVGSPQLADDLNAAHDNRMWFDKSKGAFRAGKATGAEWDDANVGTNSIALGLNTTANASYGVALGRETIASGSNSTAMGRASTANAAYGTAMGFNTTAAGSQSTAMGNTTVAFGVNSTAMGNNTQAGGTNSISMGRDVIAGDAALTAGLGDGSMALGLMDEAVIITTRPEVTGIQSMGIFMGDQDGLVMSAANTMGLFGGKMVIDPAVPATNLSADTALDVIGTLKIADGGETCAAGVAGGIRYTSTNALHYCDGTAWQTLVYSGSGTGGIWENSSDVVRLSSSGAHTTADFVFGSPQLDDDADPNHDYRMFFDKSKGAFRAGNVVGTKWDDVNRGSNSVAMGNNTQASGAQAFAAGYNTSASGQSSVAMGEASTASGAYSLVVGRSSTATQTSGIALGRELTSSGAGSIAIGRYSTSSGNRSVSLGLKADALADHAFAFGMGDAAGVYPKVSGISSLGIFMGDQSGVDVTAANTMALMGATGFGIGTVSPATLLDVQGTIRVADGGETCTVAGDAGMIRYNTGTMDYCDGTSWKSFATASGSSPLSGLSAATATNTIANANFAQVWNWDTLTTETAMALGSTSVTSGKVLDINSSATGFTGTLADVTLSGSNAANTGTLIKSSVTGALSNAVPMMVTNLGAGDTFRVNDETGDADATPFIIDAAGNVGIGTATPGALLNIVGKDGTAATANASSVFTVVGGAGYAAGNGNGGGISLTSGAGTGTGTGGDISIKGGNAVNAAGGAITIASGNSNTTAASTNIYGGGFSNSTTRSFLTLGGSGSITTGSVVLSSGVSGTVGNTGSISIKTPNVAGGWTAHNGGAIDLTAGNGGGTGSGGAISLTAGNGGATNIDGANIVLNPGAKGGTGADGNIVLADLQGKVGVGTATPATLLDITGTIKIADGGETCAAGVAGGIRYGSNSLSYCDGTTWQTLGISGASSNIFEVSAGVVSSIDANVPYATADFVFGSPQLDDDADATHDSRVYFDKSKGAFRAGAVAGSEWDDVNVGTNSIAMGYGTTASGAQSIAMGWNTAASGNGSTATGTGTTASATYSTAIGYNSIASGLASTAIGWGADAIGNASTAIGVGTTASGYYSTTLGRHVTAGDGVAASGFGDGSMALGLIDNAVTITTPSQVTGIQSYGIFMGDQDGLVMSANNTMGLFGGKMVIDPAVPATNLSADTALDVIGTLKIADGGETCTVAGDAGMIRYNTGTMDYCDGTSWKSFATSAGTVALSGVTAATATNVINNANFAQRWEWNTLATEAAMRLASTSITSGKILEINSSATGFTGTLADVTLSGSNALNTGTLVKSSVTGALSNAVPMMVTNLGAGDTFRVNDETGDADATPFIIDAAGAVGIGTATPSAEFHVSGGDVLATGTYTGTSAVPVTGAGTRMFFHPAMSALRAGYVSGTQWNDASIGGLSVAFGADTIASGTYSTALGFGTTASGNRSMATGTGTTASGSYSTAMGSGTAANGTSSTAMGQSTTASGSYSTAMGNATTASGASTVAMGQNTTAAGWYSTAMGLDVTIPVAGAYSFALGLGDAIGALPQVSGASSFGVFMGDQSGVNLSTANTVSFMGSTGFGIGTVSPATLLDVQGTLKIADGAETCTIAGDAGMIRYNTGTMDYCDGVSWKSFATSAGTVALSGVTAATATNTIANANFAQAWNWDTLTTETAMALGSTSVTTGKVLDINSSAVGFTGTLADVTLSGSNALNTGTLVKSSVTGALSNAVPMMVTNLGVGDTFRVNDETGDGDATPFIIDAAGAVGIGTATPSAEFHVSGGDILVTGNHIGASSVPVTGAGTRMFFHPAVSAFRAGAAASTQWDDASIGIYSTAMGQSPTASGQYSTAIGYYTTASGNWGTALGAATTASANYSTAIGQGTTASGMLSTAVGWGTKASGHSSTSMGRSVVAGDGTTSSGFGDGSLAVGLIDDAVTITTPSQVTGIQSYGIFMGDQDGLVMSAANTMGLFGGKMVIDPAVPATNLAASTGGEQDLELDVTGDIGATNFCDADGNNCFTAASVGSVTPAGADREIQFNSGGSLGASSTYKLASDGDLLLTGTHTGTASVPATGAGTRMFFDTQMSAFRAGYAAGTNWDDASIGAYSMATGYFTVASGNYSTALGANTEATNTYSTALGYLTNAFGSQSTAMGYSTTASGLRSTAMGSSTTASGDYSTAIGLSTTASSNGALASGWNSAAGGLYSTALGRDTTASGDYSTATGYGTTAGGLYSAAFGRSVNITANGSMGMGLTGTVPATAPIVSGTQSMGVFMGNHSAVNFNAANTLGLFGGSMVIDPAVPATQLTARGVLDLGAATDALIVPNGTEAQRPGTPVNGMIRYKTDTGTSSIGFEVYEAGAWVAMGAAVSDKRLKTDIKPLDSKTVLDRLAQIDTYSYKMKNAPEGKLRYGVIAQELVKTFPELVNSPKNPDEMKSVRYQEFTALLIEATKALKSENETLRAEIAANKAHQDEITMALDEMREDVAGLKLHTGYGFDKAGFTLGALMAMLMMLGGVMIASYRRRTLQD